jgi:hypothetical protein
MRLTLMLKNIPNKATDQDVMRYIEEVSPVAKAGLRPLGLV